MIRTARQILKDCIFANGYKSSERQKFQISARNNISYLAFLTRTSYNKHITICA